MMKTSIHTISALLFAAVTLLSFPAAAGQPPQEDWYKRIYTGLDREALYSTVGKVFESAGYQLAPTDPQGVAVASRWKEGANPVNNQYVRTRLRSHFTRHNTETNKFMMVLDLIKEVRANKDGEWRNQRIDFYNDTNYMSTLKKVDDAVVKAGGKVSLMPPPPRP